MLLIYFDGLFIALRLGLGLWCLTPFSPIFQLYREVIFIDRGNRSTRRK